MTMRTSIAGAVVWAIGCGGGSGGGNGGKPDGGAPDAAATDGGADADCSPVVDGFAWRAEGAGELRAAAGRVVITPTGYETFVDADGDAEYDDGEEFFDCGLDRLCEGDPGYPGPDEGEGDGEFQALFIAGFQGAYGATYGGRPMQGVHDDVEARLLYVEQGDARLLLVEFDLIGLFHKYANFLKRRLREELCLHPGAVVVASVHDHEAPDSMGIWSTDGVSQAWIAPVMDAVLAEAEAVVARTEPVRLRAGAAYPPSCIDEDTGELVFFPDCDEPPTEDAIGAAGSDLPVLETDLRNPFVRDPLVLAAALERPDGEPVAVLVNWTLHPETLADENPLVSSDFVGPLRARVEERLGGVAIYASGAVGGMMTPLRGTPAPLWSEDGERVTDGDGAPVMVTEATFDKARSIGFEVAEAAVAALADAEPADATLTVETRDLDLPLAAQYLLLFQTIEYYDEADRMLVMDAPGCAGICLRTQLTFARLGPLSLVTVPGELLPEFVVGRPEAGGFVEVPALRDAMPGDVKMIVGLGNNELGYVIPPEDFVGPEDPNYYEESVSPGAEASRLLVDAMGALVTKSAAP